jgi:hypothetical protein
MTLSFDSSWTTPKVMVEFCAGYMLSVQDICLAAQDVTLAAGDISRKKLPKLVAYLSLLCCRMHITQNKIGGN